MSIDLVNPLSFDLCCFAHYIDEGVFFFSLLNAQFLVFVFGFFFFENNYFLSLNPEKKIHWTKMSLDRKLYLS